MKSLREFLDGYSKSRLGWLHNAGDRHDTSARHRQLLLLVVALMLIAAVRARAEFGTSQAFTWLMLGGCVAVMLGSAYLWYTMEILPRRPKRGSRVA